MTSKVLYFEKPGAHNTDATLEISHQRAKELGIRQIVVASTYGNTARKALEVFKNLDVKLTVVTICKGFEDEGWIMEGSVREELQEKGANVLTSVHALGDDVNAAFLEAQGGYAPNAIVSETLRRFCQGMKVCVEITLMAADAGLIDIEEEVIAIAGTDRGADTAIVLKPAYPRKFLELKIREVLAMPR